MKCLGYFLALLGVVVLVGAGCNESGGGGYGSGHDFGDNDPAVYVCIGDSITQGEGGVTPYPSNLAMMLGKTVINQGSGGERVASGAARAAGVLDRYKPGFLLILHGVNDVMEGQSAEYIVSQLNVMVQAAKARQVLPAVSTITPFVGNREVLNGGVYATNRLIRDLASREGILLVDCERVVDGRSDYVLSDGLHLSEAGSIAVAAAWSDRL